MKNVQKIVIKLFVINRGGEGVKSLIYRISSNSHILFLRLPLENLKIIVVKTKKCLFQKLRRCLMI